MKDNKYSHSIVKLYDEIIKAGYYDHKKVSKALSAILGKKRKVLELGVGTGLLAENLIGLGYLVSGIDFTKGMVSLAKKRLGRKAKLYYQNVLNLDLPEKYDSAISEGGPWLILKDANKFFLQGHLKTKKENFSALKKVNEHLVKNGILILNIQKMHEDLGLEISKTKKYEQKIKRSKNWIDKEYFVFNKEKRIAYQRSKYRIFNKKEFQDLFKKSGFKFIGIDSSKMFFIFKKI